MDNELLEKQQVIFEQNNQILATITTMSKQYEDILLRVHSLEKENKELISRIDLLEGQLESIDRSNRSKNVEIRGIPEINGENLKNVLYNIGQTTKSKLDLNSIETAHRVVLKINKDQRRPIVCKFKTNIDRDQFLTDIKNFNKEATSRDEKLNTSILGIAGSSSPVYVGEQLTFRAKHLWYLARKAKKENVFKYVWIKHGQIYARRDVGTPVILVNDKTKHLLSPPFVDNSV